MKKLLEKLRRAPKQVALTALAVAAIVTPAIAMAWGPDRATFTIANPAPYVTFNSITDNPAHGDERNFMQVKPTGAPNSAYSEKVNVEAGKEYDVFVYYHNNAKTSLNASGVGIAQGAKVRAQIPAVVEGDKKAVSYIEADNANPKSVWDDVTFASATKLNLDYVPGSATIHSKGKVNGKTLPDSIVAGGAALGYDDLNGVLPGCEQFSGYVVFRVKATAEKPDFTIKKEVREADKNATWAENVKVAPGTKVNYRLTFTNTGKTDLKNVQLKDQLPAGMSIVSGSVKIMNASHPNGAPITNGDQLVANGVNIGSYTPGSNALVVFDATVAAEKDLPCGKKTFRNVASAKPEGQNPKEDDANVETEKKCEETKQPIYKCTGLNVETISPTQFKFTGEKQVENAEFVKFIYVIRDEAGKEIARNEQGGFTIDKVGKYTAEAILVVKVDGQEKQATAAECKKPFEVKEQPKQPVYRCDSLTVKPVRIDGKDSRDQFEFTVQPYSEGNVKVKEYSFDYDDGQTQIVGADQKTVKHTYQKAGDYTAKVAITFEVDSKTVPGVTGDKCKVSLNVKPVPPAECKPGIPMNDARCEEKPGQPGQPEQPKTPESLPSTGPEAILGSLFGSSALGLGVHTWLNSRRALRSVVNKK